MSHEDQNSQNKLQNIPEAAFEDFLSLNDIYPLPSAKHNTLYPQAEDLDINNLYFTAAALLIANQAHSRVIPEEAGLRQTFEIPESNGNRLSISWNVRANKDDRTKLETDAPLRGYDHTGRTRYHTPIDIEVTDTASNLIQSVQVMDSSSEMPNTFDHALAIDYQLPGAIENRHMPKLAVKSLTAQLAEFVPGKRILNSKDLG